MTVGFSYTTYSVFKGDGVANVSLELTEAAEREVTVLIQTGNGMATGNPGERLEIMTSMSHMLSSHQLPVTTWHCHKM